jgi:hypothetical protein
MTESWRWKGPPVVMKAIVALAADAGKLDGAGSAGDAVCDCAAAPKPIAIATSGSALHLFIAHHLTVAARGQGRKSHLARELAAG